MSDARTPRDANRERLEEQLAESNTGVLMSDEMLANAMAHGQPVDLDRLHEESLAPADEPEQPQPGKSSPAAKPRPRT